MTRHLLVFLLGSVITLAVVPTAVAETYFVDAGNSIQTALDGASAGDVVQVGAGTFTENLTMRVGVQLIGAGPDQTTLDGNHAESCIYVPTGAGQSTVIEGFRIANGDGYQGGGIYIASLSSPTVTNCLIEGNNSHNFGGGIYIGAAGSPKVQFCTVKGNTAQEGAGIYYQGSFFEGTPEFLFNVVCHNEAAVTGGGIHIVGCELGATVTNNSIAGNTTQFGYGSGISIVRSIADVTNNIIAFNEGGHGFMAQSSAVTSDCNVVYGNVEGDYNGVDAGPNDISQDPLFCDLEACDLTVASGSPAVSSLECGLIGALPVGCGFTGTEETSWGGVKRAFR